MTHSKTLAAALLVASLLFVPSFARSDDDKSDAKPTADKSGDKTSDKPAEKAPPADVTTQGSVDAGGNIFLIRPSRERSL